MDDEMISVAIKLPLTKKQLTDLICDLTMMEFYLSLLHKTLLLQNEFNSTIQRVELVIDKCKQLKKIFEAALHQSLLPFPDTFK